MKGNNMGATGDQLKGHGKEAAGLILGNEQLEAEGRHDREVGEAEAKIDKVERKADEVIDHAKTVFGRLSDSVKESLHRK